jgi:hypothetical protein
MICLVKRYTVELEIYTQGNQKIDGRDKGQRIYIVISKNIKLISIYDFAKMKVLLRSHRCIKFRTIEFLLSGPKIDMEIGIYINSYSS